MKKAATYIVPLLCILLASFYQGCTTKWSKVIKYGTVQAEVFHQTIDIDIINGLIIVPVQLRGQTYRFLFDTGAPNSISTAIQNEYSYKIVSKGHIVDSDQNRSKVEYIQVDSLIIGSIPFFDQTAFVGDFTKNPLFECLDIDGIVGSNLMRFCNWTIDYQSKTIILTNEEVAGMSNSKIPFQTDEQFNLLIDLKIGEANLRNITVDYGSNGSLSIPNKAYGNLKDFGEITRSFEEIGQSQSGLIGKVVELKRETTFVDSLWLGTEYSLDAQLTSDGSGLLGSKVLSNWVITIDWRDQELHFLQKKQVASTGAHGFGIGYSSEQGIFVQSVILESSAYLNGLRPGMKVLKINDTVFDYKDGFCSIANSFDKSQQEISVSVVDFDGNKLTVTTAKSILR